MRGAGEVGQVLASRLYDDGDTEPLDAATAPFPPPAAAAAAAAAAVSPPVVVSTSPPLEREAASAARATGATRENCGC